MLFTDDNCLDGQDNVCCNVLCPPTEGGEENNVLMRIVSAFACGLHLHLCSFLSVLYLVNRWLDSNQTCMDILVGRRKQVFMFW